MNPEDFGTLSIRLHLSQPTSSGRLYGKAVVLQRYHGSLSECKQMYADWLQANAELRNSTLGMSATWETRVSVHQDDLPPAKAD